MDTPEMYRAEIMALQRERDSLQLDVASYRAGALGYARLAVDAGRLLADWLRWVSTEGRDCDVAALIERTREFLGLRDGERPLSS